MGMRPPVIRVTEAQRMTLDSLKAKPEESYATVMDRLLAHAAAGQYSQAKKQIA